jgi:alkaline phosphatase
MAPAQRPKNIILLIGDGMGLSQVSAGLYAHGNSLQLEKFPVTGLITTHSSKQLITDSAAGATAFACGCKTANGVLGLCADKTPCLTLLEEAKQRALAVGLVSSSSLTHATPAAFLAHVGDRAEMEQIATFFPKSGADLLIGGGLRYFRDRRTDQQNLWEAMRQQGYQLSDFAQQTLAECRPDPSRPFAWFAAELEPPSVEKGRDYLPLAARLAPSFLKKRGGDKGFFLMIEGAQIDWACHAKDAPNAVREMLDFDRAIGEVLRFAEADGQTLVIVTADHETGGMALEQSNSPDSLEIDFATGYHTASLVPVFAYGPGAAAFGGVYDNTDIYLKMRALYGWPERAAGN